MIRFDEDWELAHHMNLIWQHSDPCWMHSVCNFCVPKMGLVCAYHTLDVEELERMYYGICQ